MRDARAAYAARRSEAARSEAAVAADARHVESMQQARMHLIEMKRRRAAAVAAEIVTAGAEAADAADAAAAEDAADAAAAEDGGGILSQESFRANHIY